MSDQEILPGNGQDSELPASVEELADSGVLTKLSRAEIDVQIATARKYPRSVTKFKREAEEMATLDEETAGSMFYVLPRAGKRVEGPSVRLAEIVGSAWGNLRYDARVVDVEERYIVAQGSCFDLEKNVAARVEVRRRITDRNGKRYNDDMIVVTANAACSIALRQAIFKVVPFTYVKDIYNKAQQVAIGKGLSMEQRRSRALEWFGKVGAKPEDLLKLLDRKGLEDVAVEDLIVLQGIKTAIADGDTTWEEVFGQRATPDMPRRASEAAKVQPPTPPPQPRVTEAATDEGQPELLK